MAHKHTGRKPGRPSILTQAKVDALLREIGSFSASRADAAAMVGVWPLELRNWLRKGAQDINKGDTTTLFAKLHLGVLQCEAQTKKEWLGGAIGLSTKAGDFRGLVEALRLRFPEQFMPGKKVTLELEKSLTTILEIAHDVLDQETWPGAYEALLKALASHSAESDEE